MGIVYKEEGRNVQVSVCHSYMEVKVCVPL